MAGSKYYGQFGGQYVSESLMNTLAELEKAFDEAINDPQFIKDYMYYLLTSPFKRVKKSINNWYILCEVLGSWFDECMNDIYTYIWNPTIQGRKLSATQCFQFMLQTVE